MIVKSNKLKVHDDNISISAKPKLWLVDKECSDFFLSAKISESTEVQLPKESSLSCSEITAAGKSPEHVQALADVFLFKVGLISATELRSKYKSTYKNWDGMKQRSKGNPAKNQSAIYLHPEFVEFASFLSHMGPRPIPTWSIDRIDPTGPYSPENCRWASKTTQSRNRTNTTYLVMDGVKKPLVEWADELGIGASILRSRKRSGWSDTEAIKGERSSARHLYSSISTACWDYTPWPYAHRETLERIYQKKHQTGERRLAFMKRYAAKQLEILGEEIDRCYCPDWHTPSEVESNALERLTTLHKGWEQIFLDSCKKLSDEYADSKFRLAYIPSRIENALKEAVE